MKAHTSMAAQPHAHREHCREAMILFLDAEWADTIGSELVSLALVSEDGTHRFYAELDPLPEQATPFVQERVYPLLQGGPFALSQQMMTVALRAFLCSISAPTVLADYYNGLDLLRYVVNGFDLPEWQADACGPQPKSLTLLRIVDSSVRPLVEDWVNGRPDRSNRRHHAMIDAEALRIAWLAANGRLGTPTSTPNE